MSLLQELQKQIENARWEDLRRHTARDAIIIVADELDLATVGEKIARDDSDFIHHLIETNKLTKPDLEQMQIWEKDHERVFPMLIVQPYVLIQLNLRLHGNALGR